jgi:ribonuclease HI
MAALSEIPAPPGIGVVIDGEGNGPIRIKKWIGHQDNNVAEYVALLEALQCALGLSARALHVFSDSLVVTNDQGIHLPQSEALFSEFDLPKIGAFARLLHIPRHSRKQYRS